MKSNSARALAFHVYTVIFSAIAVTWMVGYNLMAQICFFLKTLISTESSATALGHSTPSSPCPYLSHRPPPTPPRYLVTLPALHPRPLAHLPCPCLRPHPSSPRPHRHPLPHLCQRCHHPCSSTTPMSTPTPAGVDTTKVLGNADRGARA